MTERKRPATRRTRANTKPKPSTELAIIPKTQLELDFERILAEMHAGFDSAQAVAMANLDRIEQMTDFADLRTQTETQLDMIEQAIDAELAQADAKRDAKGDPVIAASTALTTEGQALSDAVDHLAQWASYVRALSGLATATTA